MAIIIDGEMRRYGVTANAIAPLARTRLTTDATPSTAGLMGGDVKEGEFDVWGPQNVAPLVTWLASDDAADVHGEVFRVGGGTVFLLQGWHTVGKVRQQATWDPRSSAPRSRPSSPRASPRRRAWPRSWARVAPRAVLAGLLAVRPALRWAGLRRQPRPARFISASE